MDPEITYSSKRCQADLDCPFEQAVSVDWYQDSTVIAIVVVGAVLLGPLVLPSLILSLFIMVTAIVAGVTASLLTAFGLPLTIVIGLIVLVFGIPFLPCYLLYKKRRRDRVEYLIAEVVDETRSSSLLEHNT